jgi:hypothetical protein
MPQVVEHPPCKHKALSSNPRTAKKKNSPNVVVQIIRGSRKDEFHVKKMVEFSSFFCI